jgi:hypothetical protein
MSLSGTLYCYRNPLASSGEKLRNPWYDTTCCPPNVERLFESLPGYFYATSRDGVYVNLYHNSELDWRLEDGTPLKLTQATSYPWSGGVNLTVASPHPSAFTLYLRWPSWAPSAEIQVNSRPISVSAKPGSYVPISRTWNPGDTVSVDFQMQPTPTVANPRVSDEYGRVALERGPLVYALEQIDQNGASIPDIFYRLGTPIAAEVRKDLLGGVTVLKVSGQVAEKPLGEEPLYEPLASVLNRPKRPVNLTFIPFYAIGNREPAPMEVWVPISKFDAGTTSASAANASVANASGVRMERHTETR